jgi:hypothetical protein
MIEEHLFTIDDAELWNHYLPSVRSVFGSLGYARICNAFRNVSPRLYVAKMGAATICYPILLRPLSELAFATGSKGKWDSTTPDYTGPMMFGEEPELSRSFPLLRDRLFLGEGVVTEFAHLHPWCDTSIPATQERVYNREIIWVDTSLDPEILWSTHFSHACRKNINAAQRNGVRIFYGVSDEHIREFYRIYKGTMERNNASAAYYFGFEFFKTFRDELSSHCTFAMAEYRDRVVAATLYLHDDNDVFSFLGGADAEFQQVRPTNMVVWETIRWAHNAGKKRLILGGGYRPDDGIFRFKATFSRLHQPFHIYKRIHLEQEYKVLEQRYHEHNGTSCEPIEYFPSYRSSVHA